MLTLIVAVKTDVNGNVCCAGDNSRCANMDCGLYKAECSGDVRECKRECVSADDCVENACCKYGITGDKECVDANTIANYSSKSYPCDPPGWGFGKALLKSGGNHYPKL